MEGSPGEEDVEGEGFRSNPILLSMANLESALDACFDLMGRWSQRKGFFEIDGETTATKLMAGWRRGGRGEKSKTTNSFY